MDGGRRPLRAVEKIPGTSLFLAALLVRLGVLAFARATGRFPEYWEPEQIARNLLAGKGFVYHFLGIDHRAYIEPLYPFLVAAVYSLTNSSIWALAIVQAAASALLASVAYAIARRVFGQRAGLAAGALIVVHPALAGYATKFHPLTFDALAIALVALATLELLDRPTRGNALILGLALGACVLTRPTILAFVAAVAAWLTLGRQRRAVLPLFLLSLAIAAVIVLPWVVRNYVTLDAFVLTRSHVGYGFWLGNHPGSTGGEGDPIDREGNRGLFRRAPAEFQRRVLSQTDEIARDRVFGREALHFTMSDPAGFAARTLRKLGYFWWFPPYLGVRYQSAEIALYRWYYVFVLALAGLGLLAALLGLLPRLGNGLPVILLLLASVSLAQSLFYVQGRHRLGVEALLIVLAGGGASALWSRIRDSRVSEPADTRPGSESPDARHPR